MTHFFEEIEEIIKNKISIFKTVFLIFKLEAKLAGLSVFPLLLNLCMLFVILITLWFSTVLIIGFYTLSFLDSVPLTALVILFLNLVLFFVLIKYLAFNLSNLSFEKTRAFLSSKESSQNDELKEKTADRHCGAGKNIIPATSHGDDT